MVTADTFLAAIDIIGKSAGPFAAAVAAVASSIAASRGIKNTKAIEEIHISINSRLSKLLELTERSAHAAGVLQEKTRTDAADALEVTQIAASDARRLRDAAKADPPVKP
jgi:hypothetical protein